MTTTSDTESTRAINGDDIQTVVVTQASTFQPRPRRNQGGLGLAGQIFILAAMLLVVTLGLTVAVAAWRAQRVADETIRDDLARAPEVFSGYTSSRASAVLEQVRSLAREPGTMAIFAEAVDLSTRLSFATEDAPAMISEGSTFFLFDRTSRVLARSDKPDGSGVGRPFASVGWVASVLDTWQGTTAFIREGDQLAIVGAAPVITGEGEGARLEGVLAVTFPINTNTLRQIQGLTRGKIAVVLDMAGRNEAPAPALGESTPDLDGEAFFKEFFADPGAVEGLFTEKTPFGPVTLKVNGEAVESLAIPVANTSGDTLGAVTLTRSRAEEMAAFRTIRRGLMVAGLVMLLISLPASFVLGRQIAQPLEQLAAGAERIRDGRLDVELPSKGAGEVGVLAGAFSAMVEDLKEKQALEQLLVDLKAQSTETDDTLIVPPPTTDDTGEIRLPEKNEIFGRRYRIRSELGSGGMGVVYRATDLELEEDVALKVLKPGVFAHATEGVQKLKQEVRLARRITHTNVIRVHDLIEADGLRCLSMEYVPGTTLLRVIKQRGTLNLGPGLQVAKQLCRGLAAVHAEGIIHRDIKPQNVMVLPNGVVKLMDFGISSGVVLDGEGDPTVVEGTPAYMSPELCRGEELNHLSDLYSLGVVLWEMFTGTMPFRGPTLGAVIKKQLHDSAPSLQDLRPEIPPELDRIIMSCLEKDRNRRPPSANAIYLTLREILVTDW